MSAQITRTCTPDLASSLKDMRSYVQSHDVEAVKAFVTQLSPGKVNAILSEDILGNEGFMSVAYSCAMAYNSFRDLRDTYTAQQLRKRSSKLEESLKKVDEATTVIKEALLSASEIRLSRLLV